MPDAGWDIVQILYWLSLSTWFGGVLFVAIAAPLIMRTVKENNPILTSVLSVNLEGQHATLLGGSIVGRIMTILMRVELACAAAMLVALGGQVILLHGGAVLLTVFRGTMFVGAVAFLIYDWRMVWPAMWKWRQEYIDHADEPEVANPALDQLNRYQSESATILFIRVALLLGMILFSANIRPVMVISA
jgi:hypothetical protein